MSYLLDIDMNNISHKIYCSRKKALYVVLNYNKKLLKSPNDIATQYRSVVYSFPEKQLLCFSPPKTLPVGVFIKNYPRINGSLINICDAIEGVMINLFFDSRINSWEIATKNAVGGEYRFYGSNKKSGMNYKNMFLDAFRTSPNQDINDIAFLNNLPKYASYTFILQHQDNQIILSIDRPRIFLVAVYMLSQNKAEYVPSFMYEDWNVFKNVNSVIEFPKKYDPQSYTELFDETIEFQKYGFVITNEFTGEMTKIVATEYENLRKIIRIEPILQYQFLCLNRIGKFHEYINFINNNKKLCETRDIYEDFISNTHKFYSDTYIKKVSTHVPEKYSTHIHKLHHQVYLPSLKTSTKKKITRKEVIDYYNNLEPRELMYILNWDRRQIQELSPVS